MTNLSRLLRMCAVEALTALLKQVSAIKLNDVNAESTDSGQEIDILAHIDVLGHSHALACKVNDGGPHQVRKALEELDSDIACIAGSGNMTPVIIVPHLSPEVQALCWERKTGCLDLEGNGRLLVEEVFIFSRFLPHRLRRFSNSREVLRGVPGGVFLGKTPLNVRGSALHQLENRYSSSAFNGLGANSRHVERGSKCA